MSIHSSRIDLMTHEDFVAPGTSTQANTKTEPGARPENRPGGRSAVLSAFPLARACVRFWYPVNLSISANTGLCKCHLRPLAQLSASASQTSQNGPPKMISQNDLPKWPTQNGLSIPKMTGRRRRRAQTPAAEVHRPQFSQRTEPAHTRKRVPTAAPPHTPTGRIKPTYQ
jgi:hypothetical protein